MKTITEIIHKESYHGYHGALIAFCLTWIIVFLLGFFAMLLFWLNWDYPTTRGFTYYYAATLGDGLFLPTIAASASASIYLMRRRFTGEQLIKVRRYRPVSYGCLFTGTFIGMLIQLSWLANDHIVVNWTIPEPHRFNAPGYWHAAYFIFIFGLYGYLLSSFIVVRRMITRWHGDVQNDTVITILYGMMWGAGTGYIMTNFIDDHNFLPQDLLYSSALIFTVLTISAIYSLLGLSQNNRGRALLSDLHSVLVFSLLGYAIVCVGSIVGGILPITFGVSLIITLFSMMFLLILQTTSR